MPLPNLFRETSSPGEGLLVVPFVTTPRSVSAPAAREHANITMIARCFKRKAPSSWGGFKFFDFAKQPRGLSFHALAHAVVVGLCEFTCLEFKIQVAQVLINHVLTLVEIGQARLVGSGLRIAARPKDEDQRSRGENSANNPDPGLRVHISVSRRARSRRASR